MARDWILPESIEVSAELRAVAGGDTLVARLLAARGLADAAAARVFLDPQYYTPTSPFSLDDMDRAMALLREASATGRRVRIWGDFDADGQTATAVLVEGFQAAGIIVDYDLPRRHEGHGLHRRAVEEAVRDGIAILVTCDTGIGETDVAAEALAAGLELIITDHHDLPPDLPAAQAVIDPKRQAEGHPLRGLSGVGVAYLLVRALLETPPRGDAADRATLQALLDLVAVGLVADVAVQRDEVRYLIQCGLEVLRSTTRSGLRAAMRLAGSEPAHVDEEDIAFQLGPRLNAAGRLADARQAVELLLTRDEAEGERLAQGLETLNLDRKARTAAAQAAVEQILQRNPELYRDRPAVIVDGAGWEPGVLGLVATELARRYQRPAVVIAHREGQPSVGSARSVAGIDIHQAIISQRHLLRTEGGHPMAAGFSLERDKVEELRRGLWAALEGIAPSTLEVAPLPIDAQVPWSELDLRLANELQRLAPYGAGNPRPVLLTGGATLTRMEDISRRMETAHRRLYLNDDSGRQQRFTWFNAPEPWPQPGERLDLAFRLSVDYWRGTPRPQLELVDWRPAVEQAQVLATTLVAGREIVDRRHEVEGTGLLEGLRARYGADLAVWAEDPAGPIEGALTRAELHDVRPKVLAVWTPPPEPAALRAVLAESDPPLLYLLPPRAVSELSPQELVNRVAGMLRAALRMYGGIVDAQRMSARLAARPAAVIAALRGLEARGVIVLITENGTLRASLPRSEAPAAVGDEEDDAGELERQLRRQRAEEQARQAVHYQLQETLAFREAYTTLSVQALLAGD